MGTLGIGPVSRMNPGAGGYSSTTSRRRKAELPKASAVTASYEVEKGPPVGAVKWLKSLVQAEAIHVSAERIVALVGRKPKDVAAPAAALGKAEKKESPRDNRGSACTIFRDALVLEAQDVALHPEKTAFPRHPLRLALLLMLGAATVFLLTVVVLDAVFGTRSLDALLAVVSR